MNVMDIILPYEAVRGIYHQYDILSYYTPEYIKLWKSQGPDRVKSSFVIAEFSPLEDCVPGESVQIKITKVVGGAAKTVSG